MRDLIRLVSSAGTGHHRQEQAYDSGEAGNQKI